MVETLKKRRDVLLKVRREEAQRGGTEEEKGDEADGEGEGKDAEEEGDLSGLPLGPHDDERRYLEDAVADVKRRLDRLKDDVAEMTVAKVVREPSQRIAYNTLPTSQRTNRHPAPRTPRMPWPRSTRRSPSGP